MTDSKPTSDDVLIDDPSNEGASDFDDEHDDGDLVSNDEVIGAAFRTSLIVLMLMGIPVIGVLIYLNLSKNKEETVEAEVAPPTVKEADAGLLPEISLEPTSSDGNQPLMLEP